MSSSRAKGLRNFRFTITYGAERVKNYGNHHENQSLSLIAPYYASRIDYKSPPPHLNQHMLHLHKQCCQHTHFIFSFRCILISTRTKTITRQLHIKISLPLGLLGLTNFKLFECCIAFRRYDQQSEKVLRNTVTTGEINTISDIWEIIYFKLLTFC